MQFTPNPITSFNINSQQQNADEETPTPNLSTDQAIELYSSKAGAGKEFSDEKSTTDEKL